MPCCTISCFVPGDIWCLPMFAGALHTDEDDGDGRRGHDGAQVSGQDLDSSLMSGWVHVRGRYKGPQQLLCTTSACRAGGARAWVAALVVSALAGAAGELRVVVWAAHACLLGSLAAVLSHYIAYLLPMLLPRRGGRGGGRFGDRERGSGFMPESGARITDAYIMLRTTPPALVVLSTVAMDHRIYIDFRLLQGLVAASSGVAAGGASRRSVMTATSHSWASLVGAATRARCCPARNLVKQRCWKQLASLI